MPNMTDPSLYQRNIRERFVFANKSIVHDLQSVDIPEPIRVGMRGSTVKKSGETAGGRGRMGSEGNRDEKEAIMRDPVRLSD